MIDLKPHEMRGMMPVTPTISCPVAKERVLVAQGSSTGAGILKSIRYHLTLLASLNRMSTNPSSPVFCQPMGTTTELSSTGTDLVCFRRLPLPGTSFATSLRPCHRRLSIGSRFIFPLRISALVKSSQSCPSSFLDASPLLGTLDDAAHRSLILCADSLAPCMRLISAFFSLSGPGRTTIQLDGTQANHCRPCLAQSQSVRWIQNGSFGIYLVIFDVQGGIARSDRSCRQMILLEPPGSGFILFVEICTLIN